MWWLTCNSLVCLIDIEHHLVYYTICVACLEDNHAPESVCTPWMAFRFPEIFFYFNSWKFIYKYINEWYGTCLRFTKKWLTRDQVTKILITHQEKKKRQVLCKFFTKNIIFELYVSLTNTMYHSEPQNDEAQ